MTDAPDLRRKAFATLFPGFSGASTGPDWLHQALRDGLGGIVLFGRNIDPDEGDEGLAELVADLRRTAPDVLVAVDEEGGDVTRLDASTGSAFPGHGALGAVDDVALTHDVAGELGRRLRQCGVDVDLAPVADVDVNPQNPVIGVRAFGAESSRVAEHVRAFVDGLQSRRVAATAKHFPGHGATSEDSHLTTPVVEAPLDVLEDRELVPFRAAIDADVQVIMTAHLRALALDPERPATLSPAVLTDLLRHTLGYEGVVMTDGLDMHAISRTVGQAEGAVQAIAAGADALCVGGDSVGPEIVEEIVEAIVAAVDSGRIPPERLSGAAERVRRLQQWTRHGRTQHGWPLRSDERSPMLRSAERALVVHGDVTVGQAPLVITLDDAPSLAAGRVPWGIGAPLGELMPGTVVVERTEQTKDDLGILDEHHERPVIVAVRGTRRRRWQVDVVHRVRAARPDLVVVDHGTPSTSEVLGQRYVLTHGAARVTAVAAARVVAGLS